MAFQIRITQNTTPVFTFTNGSSCNVPGGRMGWYLHPGAETDPTTDESLQLEFMGGITSIRANVKLINNALRQAYAYSQSKQGEPVYLEVKMQDADDWYRAQLMGGTLNEFDLDRALYSGHMDAVLSYERENGFDGAEAQIPLSNTNAANNTSGLTVYNANDAYGTAPNKRYNWVNVPGASLAGDLPGKARVEIANTGAVEVGDIWMAQNVYSNPLTFAHVLEGETSTLGVLESGAYSTHSGAQGRQLNWSGTSLTKCFSWPLSTALLNAARGSNMRVMIKWNTPPSEAFAQLTISGGLDALWTSPLVLLPPWDLAELATVHLPPYLIRVGDLYPLALNLYLRSTSAPTNGCTVDFVQLSPVDGFRHYQHWSYSLPATTSLVDDGINDELYVQYPDGRLGSFTGIGEPLRLWPGRDQRLIFLAMSASGICDVTRTLSIKLYYRPRRLSL
jgi:hypothetical protein